MKVLHWIIFSLGFWIAIVPIIGHDVFKVVFNQTLSPPELMSVLSWDGFLIGLAIMVLALVIVTMEQASSKTPGLVGMHWLQVLLGLWVAIASFALNFDYALILESHAVSGVMISIFALLQIHYEIK